MSPSPAYVNYPFQSWFNAEGRVLLYFVPRLATVLCLELQKHVDRVRPTVCQSTLTLNRKSEHIFAKYPRNSTVDKVKSPAKRGIPQTGCHVSLLYTCLPPRVVLITRRMLTNVATNIRFIHAPHNDVSGNDGPHIRRWSHNII
jgi:hypothetical protein